MTTPLSLNLSLSDKHLPAILAIDTFADKNKWSPVNYVGKKAPKLKTKKKKGIHIDFKHASTISRIRVCIAEFIREEKEIAPTLSVSFNISALCRMAFPGYAQATAHRCAVAHELAQMQGTKLVPIAYKFIY